MTGRRRRIRALMRSVLLLARDILAGPSTEPVRPAPSVDPVVSTPSPEPVRARPGAPSIALPTQVAPAPSEAAAAPPVTDEMALEPEDVLLDAMQLVHQAGIGWDLTFLDLRPDVARATTGVVAEAVPLERAELQARLPELDATTTWVVYDDDDRSAASLALSLRGQGYHDVFALEGGLEAWRRAGGPVAGVT